MPMKTLNDLFEDTLRDMYYAEKKLVTTLPKMAKKASNEELAEAFTNHKAETEGQVERLEKVFKLIGKSPRGKTCEAMNGLVEEGSHVMEESEEESVMDAGLIAAGSAVEHYEIARYNALIKWADQLDMSDASSLLEENLAEEKAADELLSSLADQIEPVRAQAA